MLQNVLVVLIPAIVGFAAVAMSAPKKQKNLR
jgi:gas vesicle protein